MQSCTIILSEAQIEKGISSVAPSLHFYDFMRESSPWPFLGDWGVSLHGTYIPPCQSKPMQHKIRWPGSWCRTSVGLNVHGSCLPDQILYLYQIAGGPLGGVWSPGAASRSSPWYRHYAQMHYTGPNPTLRLAETHSNSCSSAGIVQEKVRMMYVNIPSQWSGCWVK